MADKSILTINGTDYNIKDAAARSTANAATTAEEYDRQVSIGSYGGRDLTSVFAAEISAKGNAWAWIQSRAKAGNFAGLRIGDYIPVTTTAGANVPAQTRNMRIAAIDHYYQCGDAPLGHHIVFLPHQPWLVAGDKAVNTSYIAWRDTNDNNGTADEKHPYLVSKLHEWEINDLLPALPSALQAVLIPQRELLEERYSASGALTESNSWSWVELGKVWSPSEMEVYGTPVWGTKGFSVGFGSKFPLFHDTAARINATRIYWWLRSVHAGSSSNVCFVNINGIASYIAATSDWMRPFSGFLVG